MSATHLRSKEWFDDDAFWRSMYPYIFPERCFIAAQDEMEKVLALTQPADRAALDLACVVRAADRSRRAPMHRWRSASTCRRRGHITIFVYTSRNHDADVLPAKHARTHVGEWGVAAVLTAEWHLDGSGSLDCRALRISVAELLTLE